MCTPSLPALIEPQRSPSESLPQLDVNAATSERHAKPALQKKEAQHEGPLSQLPCDPASVKPGPPEGAARAPRPPRFRGLLVGLVAIDLGSG